MSFHENFKSIHTPQRSSERSFGLVFAAVFFLFTAWHFQKHHTINFPLGIASIAFFVAALMRPIILKPLNYLWLKFGRLLERIITPLTMGVMFYLIVTPFALCLRLIGKDFLKRKPVFKSYWTERADKLLTPDSMRRPF